MIPKVTSKFQTIFTQTPKKIPPREVIITSDNGKDRISDVFINGVPRISFLDVLKDIVSRYIIN